jgi:hypothetical protein
MRACDYNVYRIGYKTTYHERVSTYGGMDSELTGKMITEGREYLCVAPTGDLAMAAFKRYHSKDEFIHLDCIGMLDDLVYLQ